MNDFGDALIVFLLGLLAGIGVYAAYTDSDRTDCEKNLPRTEQCVQVWKPSKEAK